MTDTLPDLDLIVANSRIAEKAERFLADHGGGFPPIDDNDERGYDPHGEGGGDSGGHGDWFTRMSQRRFRVVVTLGSIMLFSLIAAPCINLWLH